MVPDAQPLSERLVLVVDDEELVCRLTARALSDVGFRVVAAHSGEEALALLSTVTNPVQLVVSDMVMPGMTGEQLAVTIAERWPTVPVLLVSGQSRPTAHFRGAFLPKPFLPDMLRAVVAQLVPPPREPVT